MTDAKIILHVNIYGCRRGGCENYIREIALKMTGYRHYLLYAIDGDSAYLDAFSGSYGILQGEDGVIADVLKALSPDHIFIYNTGAKSMRVFLDLRNRLGFSVMKSFHDYGMIYMGTGYNRLTLKRAKDPIGWRSLSGCFKRDAFTRRFHFDDPWRKRRLLAEVNDVDAIEVHTEDMENTLVRNGIDAGKIFWNPPWAAEPALNSASPDPAAVLFVGNLIRGKGLYLLLKALRKVKFKYTLKVAGDGYERESLQRYSRKHGLNVLFLGSLPAERLTDLYLSSAFVVLPSILEPFGFVILEAFSCKRPVIAFQAGGPAEILADGVNGCLIEPFDTGAMASKIEELIKSPETAARLGQAGYDTYRAKYTFEHHLQRLREKLAELEK